MGKLKNYLLLFFILLILLTGNVTTAPIYTIQVDVNPRVVPADGTSTAVITAQIREEGKGLVTQSVRVDFATTLGTITPWVNTEGGVARAEITSTKQGTAVITISCMGSTVQTNVTFVSEQEFASAKRARCINVIGDYLAWCADNAVLDATGNVKIIYGKLVFEGDSFQIDARLSILRALGRIRVSNGEKVIEGDRLFWDFTANRGLMLKAKEEVSAVEIEGVGLVESPSKGYIPSYAFEFYDPSNSRVVVIAKEVDIFPGEKVYLRRTTTFVGGSKVFSLPYQLISFSAYGDYTQQVLNWGTSGVAFDFPFYFALKENYAGALRLRYATGSGIEVYTRRQGWNLALDQQYEFPKARGGLLFEEGESNDWGLTWSHNHFLGKNLSTNLYLNYLAEGDRYNRVSLRNDWKGASFLYNFYQRKYGIYQSEGQDMSLRLRPQRLGNYSLTMVGRLYKWDILGKELFLQLVSPSFRFGKSHLDFSLETGYQWANEDKGLYSFNTYFGRELGNFGNISIAYSKFNGTRYGGFGGENIGLNFLFRKGKWNGYLYFNNGLEDNNRFSYGNLSYYLNPDWGLHFRSYFYKLGPYKFTDRQYILSRSIGNREAYIYWSERDKKIGFEISQGGL